MTIPQNCLSALAGERLATISRSMYRLERTGLAWILDAPDPSSSFPSLKQHEMKQFGEYRTQRYALRAFDQLVLCSQSLFRFPDLGDDGFG